MNFEKIRNALPQTAVVGAQSIRAKLLMLVLPVVAIGLVVLSVVIYRYMSDVLDRQILKARL